MNKHTVVFEKKLQKSLFKQREL